MESLHLFKRINTHSLLRQLSRQSTRQAARTTAYRRYAAAADSPTRRPRRRKQKYEKFSDAKLASGLMPTTTSLESPFEYNSGDSIEDYKKKAELSPWTPVPDSVARKIFDRAIPEDDEHVL